MRSSGFVFLLLLCFGLQAQDKYANEIQSFRDARIASLKSEVG